MSHSLVFQNLNLVKQNFAKTRHMIKRALVSIKSDTPEIKISYIRKLLMLSLAVKDISLDKLVVTLDLTLANDPFIIDVKEQVLYVKKLELPDAIPKDSLPKELIYETIEYLPLPIEVDLCNELRKILELIGESNCTFLYMIEKYKQYYVERGKQVFVIKNQKEDAKFKRALIQEIGTKTSETNAALIFSNCDFMQNSPLYYSSDRVSSLRSDYIAGFELLGIENLSTVERNKDDFFGNGIVRK